MNKPVYFPSMSRRNPGVVVPNERLYLAYGRRQLLIVPAPNRDDAAQRVYEATASKISISDIFRLTTSLMAEKFPVDFSVFARPATVEGVKAPLSVIHRDDPSVSGYCHALWVMTRRGITKQPLDTLKVTQGCVLNNVAPIGGVEVFACRPLPTPTVYDALVR